MKLDKNTFELMKLSCYGMEVYESAERQTKEEMQKLLDAQTKEQIVEIDADGNVNLVGKKAAINRYYFLVNAPLLFSHAEALEAENKRLQQWVNDLQAGMFINCVYCGHRYGRDDGVECAMADVLKQHIEQCPEHPMSHLKAENARLREALEMCLRNDKTQYDYGDAREDGEVLPSSRRWSTPYEIARKALEGK